MSDSLLATKLHIPPVSPKRVARPRLLARLTEGLTGSLTLISAPAGFGKTTLLGEWHTSDEGKSFPLAWLSLDTDDNDPLRFFTYVVAALTKLEEGICETTLPLLQSLEPPPVKVIVTALINDWGKVSFPFALVLDDYHSISSPPIHEALGYLLDHLPSQMHLVILTRADPPLPLARLRARNQLVELRAGDMRFTNDEAAAFLNRTMGLNLSAEDISILEQRTEGWIAGLQMAGLSMRGRQDLPSFIAAFTGDHRFILDYLTEEVLQRQPEQIQRFLLQTSVLDRMSGPLCDAIAERTAEDHLATSNLLNSQTILEELERANVFVVPLDDERRWYRYHHLFADLLRSRLRHLEPDFERPLQLRASDWYAQQGLMDEAISYALVARDFERAATLIEQNASAMSMHGRLSSLSAWISSLPESAIVARPRLGLAQAWALFFELKMDRMQARLDQIERDLAPDSPPWLCGELALLRGVIARFHGQVDRTISYSQQALEQLPLEKPSLRSRACIFLGLAYLENDTDKGQQAFAQALTLAKVAGADQGVLAASYFLAWTLMLRGSLRQAAEICRDALRLVEPSPYLPRGSYAHLAMGELLYEWNDLGQATEHIQKGIELAELGGNADVLFNATLAAVRVQRARGEWELAQQRIREAEQVATRGYEFMMTAMVNDEQVLLWLAQNKLREMSDRVRENPPSAGSASLLASAIQQITWARCAIARQEPRRAIECLTHLLEQLERAGMLRLALQTLSLQALALVAEDKTDQALDVFARALSRAEAVGYVRTFLDEGAPMAKLLRHAGSRGIAPQYVARLLSEFDRTEGVAKPAKQPLIDPLSERELEVLRLVALGKSNDEVAEELVLATGTVKKHLSNIFGKLNAQNRTECVARARELRLL